MAPGKSEVDGGLDIFYLSTVSALHIFTLFTLAVSHPIYAVLGQADHAPFFVAHQARGLDIAIFVLVLSFILPAVICLALWLLKLLSNRLASIIFVVLFFLLFFAALLPVPEKWLGEPGILVVILPLIVAVLATLLYVFTNWARSFVTILSLGIIASPVLFLFMPSMQAFLVTPQSRDFSVTVSSADSPDIVMVIFDELPLVSLLDENHEIDPVRYPNFHRLAGTSNWYRNSITNHYATTGAIASLLVGDEFSRYSVRVRKNAPTRSAVLDRSNIPDNLFTLLEDHYDISAIESTSKLALVNDSTIKFAPPLQQRISSLMADAFVLYAHVLVPSAYRFGLPVIDGQWGRFADAGVSQKTQSDWDFPGNAVVVKQFINQLQPTEKPALYYLHVMLPHFPFIYTERGGRHSNKFQFLTEQLRKATGSNNWPGETVANLAWQAHLLQVSFVDLLLGKVLDRLIELDIFDDSMLIVTADHGLSFFWNPGDVSGEKMSVIQASETLHVPLFIKLPGQDKGHLSEAPVQTIDIVPTIADYLGLDAPWETGGISVFRQIPEGRMRNAYIPDRRAFGPVIDPDYHALKHKIQIFGTGSIERLHLSGPLREIVGKPVTAFAAGESIGRVRIDREEQYAEIAPETGWVPVYVEGEISYESVYSDVLDGSLAISVNGIIRNTTTTTVMKTSDLRAAKNGVALANTKNMAELGVRGEIRSVHFLTRLPVESYVDGKNEIHVYAIVKNENGSPPTLRPFEKYAVAD